MYLRPQDTLDINDLEPVANLATTSEILIGADFNAKHPDWGGNILNASGRNLNDFRLSCPDIKLLKTCDPTRVNAGHSSYIDFFIASTSLQVQDDNLGGLQTILFESDHKAVKVILTGQQLNHVDPPMIFNFTKINVKNLNKSLCRNLSRSQLPIDRNVTRPEIDTCVDLMGTAFREAMEVSIPRVKPRNGNLQKLPPHILHFMEERKRLSRIAGRTGDPGRRNLLRATVFNLDKIIQGSIRCLEQNSKLRFLNGTRVGPKTFQRVKSAAGIGARAPIPDIHSENAGILVTDQEKAKIFSEIFVSSMAPEDPTSSISNDMSVQISSLEDGVPISTFGGDLLADGSLNSGSWRNLPFIEPAQIGVALKNKPNKKSSGPDGIPDCVLRKTNLKVWTFLAILINHCINLSYFPMKWREAVTIPVPKPGADRSKTGSYRPISLLSTLSKLLEGFILSDLFKSMEEKNVLFDGQFGFRKGLSTSHALVVLGDHIAKNLNKRCPTICVSLDISKAFDSVWHRGLIAKMLSMDLNRNVCKIVASFLADRSFRVRVGEIYSDMSTVRSGVPQGSLLGPILFNIFMADLPRPRNRELLLCYADDILIASSGPRPSLLNARLNSYLAILSDFFSKWRLRLNVAKSTCCIIKGKRRHLFPNARRYTPRILVNNQDLIVSSKFKYLGVIIDEDYSFKPYLD